jgi:hypothetical protein
VIPNIQAKSAAEFIDLVDRAIAEIDDLNDVLVFDQAAKGNDEESFTSKLEVALMRLKKQLLAGEHEFKNEDLPFMQVVEDTDAGLLPFRHLLVRINETHRKGLNLEA